MSILLEALRKSEKNQNLHKAPTIHTDDQPGAGSEPLQTGPLALLLVVTLFVSGWFVWHQYQPPAGSYQPPVTLTANRSREAARPVAEEKGAGQAVRSNPVANLPAAQKRTPVESYQPPANSVSQTMSGPSKRSPADKRQPGAAKTDNTSSAPSRQINAGNSEPAVTSTANEKPVQAVGERYHPGEPEPISYWELPDSVRADIPEIKFSVLVYATDPADRFVLINGERLAQGGSPQSGLVIKEIRRDGVVFTYRLYQFLVGR